MKIADFFASGQETNEEITKVMPRNQMNKSLPAKSQVQAQEKEMRMTVNLKIEKPDIILVEHMDNINTNAIIMNVSTIILKYSSVF